MSSLCEFAHWFSSEVGKELAEGRQLCHQYRETTWTDRCLIELKKLRDRRIIVKASNERFTAADMDWWFVNRQTGTSFCLRLQAKILHYRAKDPALWDYNELTHPRQNPGKQSRTLIASATSAGSQGYIYPYYLFYNPNAGGHKSLHTGGITVMDGFAVSDHIAKYLKTKNSASPKGISNPEKHFKVLAPSMIRLSELLCVGNNSIPYPEEIAEKVGQARRTFNELRKVRLRGVSPRPSASIPAWITRLMEMQEVIDEPEEKRSTRDVVIFASGE
jgi:hypothetical protein